MERVPTLTPGDAGPFILVAADALTMKVREGGRVINAVVLVANWANADGRRAKCSASGRDE
jgi:transposase-like protein